MEAPIRVAHVMGKMVGGGVEQVVMNYYRNIDRARVQFDFLVDSDSTLVPREEIESLGGRVFIVPPYQHVFVYQKVLTKMFREQGWKIVHSHVNALSVFSLRAAKRAGVPVRIAHGHSASGGHDPAKNAMKALLRPFANVYPTCRAACSHHAGEWLFGEGSDFVVIPNAIDLDAFRFDSNRRAVIRKKLGFSEDQLVIGHVGRFAPPKNQEGLVRAFAQVVKCRPTSRLVFVGEGRQRAEIEELAASICPQGSVLFLGQRDDVADLYQVFDVFCLPSEFEGLGMVVVEAEAAGLPCVLSDQTPHEADLTNTALFLPCGDVPAWAKALYFAEVGKRYPVVESDFKDYDIRFAAKRLSAYYLGLEEGGCNE